MGIWDLTPGLPWWGYWHSPLPHPHDQHCWMGMFGQGQDHSCPEASLRSITVGPGEPIWTFLWHAFVVNLVGQNRILSPQLVQSHRKHWTKRRRCWWGIVLPMILRRRFKLTQTSNCFWPFSTISDCFCNSVLLSCWIKCLICILICVLWKMNKKLQGLWLPTSYPNLLSHMRITSWIFKTITNILAPEPGWKTED